ncbi:hypothetical protein M0804_012396 [Polistes exclamans]|nr:hypothetical protein M0804_012396 [Polistes exclamans]
MGDIRAGLEELKLDGALFANVKYYVSGEGDPKILNLLQEGGAERSNYLSDFVTHLIAGYDALENDISVAKDLYEIPAVTQNWILLSVKCNKLLPTRYFSPEENQLFSNVRACISQISRADSKILWAIITLQGGKCQLRLDRYCTHLITGKPSGLKYDAAMRHHIHIVTPDWVTECYKKVALVNEIEYHPRLLIYPSPNTSTAMITGFMDEDTENSAAQEEQDRTKAVLEQLKQRMPWNQPSPPVSSNVLQVHNNANHTATTATYPNNGQNAISLQQQQQPQQQPQQQQQQQHLSRSVPSTSLSNAPPNVPSIQIQNRQAQQGPHIAVIRSPGKPGQPAGLQWIQQPRPQMMRPQIAQPPGQKPTALANMLTNRLQGGAAEGSAAGQLRLMTAQHRPPPPPSQDPQLLAAYQRRTLGNITNGAPAGAPMKMQYAPVMQQPKAQFYGHNPNLKLPPNLFLLGCIFVIVEYDVQRPNEVLVWKQVIEKYGGEVEPQYCGRATHVLAITQKHPTVVQALREGRRCVSAYWLSDVVNKQQVLPPWHALHFPTPYGLNELPCTKQIVSLSGFEGEERTKVKYMLEALGAKLTSYFSRHNTLLVCKRPDGQKYKKAREWQTAVVNAQWLTDFLCGVIGTSHQLDAPKYQQFSLGNPFRLDYSLVPHIMAAWKVPINITQESYDKVQQVGQGPNSIRKSKKPRLDVSQLNKDPHLLGLDEPIVVSNPDPPPPDKQPKILFSGINPRKHAKRIRELGGALAATWQDATHLVMSAPIRTVKLLCCLSRCKFIVTLQWLLDCSAKNTFLDESGYLLGDVEFENNFNCNIEKVLASPNRGTVLKGKIFYVTPSVIPSPSAISEIIESAGGVMEKTRRSLTQIQDMNSTKLNYIIVTHENDLHLLTDVLQANISVFSAEIVLGAVARQYFQVDATNQS